VSRGSEQSDGIISRREFGKRAALTGAAAFVPASVAGQSEQPSTPRSAQEAASAQEARLPPAAQAEVEARYQQVIRKWGDRLNDAQKHRVREILIENERMLEPIRAFELSNGDPPAPVLRFTSDAAEAPQQRAAASRRGD
jgi:hypothetical protein